MKKKSRLLVSLLVFVMLLALTGCGSAGNDKAYSESMSMTGSSMPKEEYYEEVFYETAVDSEDAANGSGADRGEASGESGNRDVTVETDRKLIKTVDMTVETREFDQMMDALESKISELGGYIENLETYNGSSYSGYRSSRDANLTIRIPKQNLNTFLETVEGISNVVRRSEIVEDVTLTYVDLESHKAALVTEQTRLLELLEKAEDINDVLVIENRLSEVRYQIESMESQLRTFDNKVDYSTVYLYVEEVRELTPVVEKNAFERIAEGFVDSLKDVGNDIVEFFIWFLVNIPYFIFWIILVLIVIVVCRVIRKLYRAHRVRRMEKKYGSTNQYGNANPGVGPMQNADSAADSGRK